MDQAEFQRNYRIIVEKIFNNWQNLRLAVEHGMGGRNGQQVSLLGRVVLLMGFSFIFSLPFPLGGHRHHELHLRVLRSQ